MIVDEAQVARSRCYREVVYSNADGTNCRTVLRVTRAHSLKTTCLETYSRSPSSRQLEHMIFRSKILGSFGRSWRGPFTIEAGVRFRPSGYFFLAGGGLGPLNLRSLERKIDNGG